MSLILRQAQDDGLFERQLLLLRGLLAGGADAGELKGMAETGIAALFGDLVFEALDDAFIEGLDLVAGAADQVVMVMMAVLGANFVACGAVDPRDALHKFLFFQDGDEAKDGGEIAALGADFFVDIGEGEGNGAGVEELHDGDATVCGAQAVFTKP